MCLASSHVSCFPVLNARQEAWAVVETVLNSVPTSLEYSVLAFAAADLLLAKVRRRNPAELF